MWKHMAIGLTLCVLPLAARDSAACGARDCALEDCPNLCSTCYNLNGYKWCHASGDLAFVNTYNHTSDASLNNAYTWATNEINFPHNGLTNAMWIYSDGVNNYKHDIDIDVVSVNDWWWGIWNGCSPSRGCCKKGGGHITINNHNISNIAKRERETYLHEMGHGIGLGHACHCNQQMDPCEGCSVDPPFLSTCDATGVQHVD